MKRAVAGLVSLFAICGVPSTAVFAQRVALRIAPPVGDTMRMQLQQRFEMESGNPGEVQAGEMRVWTRAIVLGRAHGYTDLLSVTDSVNVLPRNAVLRQLHEAQRALEGRTVHLRVDEHGGISVGDGPDAVFGMGTEMPSVLPSHRVVVGQTWVRDMRVPLSATRSSVADVRTMFRLDSLAGHGAVAYVSFHGAVSHDHSHDGEGTIGKTVGTLVGTMQIDRRLAWITDSQMVVSVVSDLQPAGKPWIHARMRIIQSLMELVGN